jgi:phage terminase small subunit
MKEKVKKKAQKKKLTIKQKKFIKNYLKTGNGTQAAKDAGYSKNCAQEIASENLSKPIIQQAVASAAEKLGISAEYVLGNFKEFIEFGKKKIIKAKQINGEIFNEEELADAQLAFKSNEALGKHLKLFTDTVEVTGKDGESIAAISAKEKLELAKQIALTLKNI